MSETSSTVGYDGARFLLTTTAPDGTTTTARLAEGGHSDADHDAAVANLRAGYATIEQWSADAAQTNTNWPTMSAAQKDAAMRETIRRLGVLLDHVGDVLITLNADR